MSQYTLFRLLTASGKIIVKQDYPGAAVLRKYHTYEKLLQNERGTLQISIPYWNIGDILVTYL